MKKKVCKPLQLSGEPGRIAPSQVCVAAQTAKNKQKRTNHGPVCNRCQTCPICKLAAPALLLPPSGFGLLGCLVARFLRLRLGLLGLLRCRFLGLLCGLLRGELCGPFVVADPATFAAAGIGTITVRGVVERRKLAALFGLVLFLLSLRRLAPRLFNLLEARVKNVPKVRVLEPTVLDQLKQGVAQLRQLVLDRADRVLAGPARGDEPRALPERAERLRAVLEQGLQDLGIEQLGDLLLALRPRQQAQARLLLASALGLLLLALLERVLLGRRNLGLARARPSGRDTPCRCRLLALRGLPLELAHELGPGLTLLRGRVLV
mmetsp:Transcript_3521/g.8709  ORF Transcript_3521/g.8709 Transcript_3521/m.8709 type:complete len:320 (+) Transcript_3521:49-1008(+)